MLHVLHLASFSGNVGDNANHRGFRAWFEGIVSGDVSWHELEIREFYWKEREFDANFAELVNRFDILVIGGCNYFELWVDDSPTGTSVGIPEPVLESIDTPIFFNALGVDPGQGASDVAIAKFTRLLDVLLSDCRYLVSVRNDGAEAAVRECVGASYAERVHRIPDGGFFADFERVSVRHGGGARQWVAVNVAGDMPTQRFGGFPEGGEVEEFAREFASAISAIAQTNDGVHFLFVPHIYSDLSIISKVLGYLPDRLRRTRVEVSPYGIGPEGAQEVFGRYIACDLVLGMRFHANVCPIGAGIPTIGLECYRQVRMLYEELGMPSGCVTVSSPGFSERLVELARAYLSGEQVVDERLRRVREAVEAQRSDFEPVLRGWLQENGLSWTGV